MEGFWAFADNHPFVAWCMAWGVWAVPVTISIPFTSWVKIRSRRYLSTNIQAQGWPTNPLMDADGDIVHPKPVEAQP